MIAIAMLHQSTLAATTVFHYSRISAAIRMSPHLFYVDEGYTWGDLGLAAICSFPDRSYLKVIFTMTDEIDKTFEGVQDLRVIDFMRRELPATAIASIENLIDAFSASNTDQRERISARVDRSFAFVFPRYARVSAGEAVRKNDPARLRRGLIALAIENDRVDWRDNLPYLSMIYNSAAKLGVDPAKLFRSVGEIAILPFRKTLLAFLDRDEKSRTVESFRFRESGEGDSFNYEYVEPPVERPSLLRLRVRTFLRRLRRALR